MSIKVPPGGTRGVPFPRFPGWLARRMSSMQLRAFHRSRGAKTGGGVHALILETVGAKTGEPRTAALGYLEEPPDSWLVIASLAGAARNPGWLYNLAKNPDATVEFGDGSRVPVRAETLDGEDLEAAWARIAVEAPEYAKYRTKTDREIPVVRLRRRS
jgi:deazaflavin-dependent oxidoreductase (nitroreductase family)